VTFRSDERRKQEWDERVANRSYLNYVPSPRWADEPPTAVVFDAWVDCSVPPSVLDQLEADIVRASVGHVEVGVQWAVPEDDGTYYGTVDTVHWNVVASDHADKKWEARLRELVSKPLSDLSNKITFVFIYLIYVIALLLIGDLGIIFSGWGYTIFAVGIGALAVYWGWDLARSAERQQQRVQRQLQGDE